MRWHINLEQTGVRREPPIPVCSVLLSTG